MKITILGNGGAVSDGLAYNSFIIDKCFLCETPPDVMNSLFRENLDLNSIRYIFVSHFHGDHFFGLPFLLLRIFFNSAGKSPGSDLTVFGPGGIKKNTLELCSLAVGDIHPLMKWTQENVEFIEASDGNSFEIHNGISMNVFSMYHYSETIGFIISRMEKSILAYFADTLWDERLLEQVNKYPAAVIADLNGEPGDPVKVHMSEEDIISNALPVSGNRTVYYGTHLKYQKESKTGNIMYVKPGDVIEL